MGPDRWQVASARSNLDKEPAKKSLGEAESVEKPSAATAPSAGGSGRDAKNEVLKTEICVEATKKEVSAATNANVESRGSDKSSAGKSNAIKVPKKPGSKQSSKEKQPEAPKRPAKELSQKIDREKSSDKDSAQKSGGGTKSTKRAEADTKKSSQPLPDANKTVQMSSPPAINPSPDVFDDPVTMSISWPAPPVLEQTPERIDLIGIKYVRIGSSDRDRTFSKTVPSNANETLDDDKMAQMNSQRTYNPSPDGFDDPVSNSETEEDDFSWPAPPILEKTTANSVKDSPVDSSMRKGGGLNASISLTGMNRYALGDCNAVMKSRGYEPMEEIGEGSYAKVKRARCIKDNAVVAIKIIDIVMAPKIFRNKFLPRELKLHMLIKHKNIIKMMDTFRVGQQIYIVMEYAARGDLLEFIHLRGFVAEEEARFMFRQLVEAFMFIHTLGICHRDVKCENILLDAYSNIKVADFGFARTFDMSTLSKTFCGSMPYVPPEIFHKLPYEPSLSDMWGLGVILFILVTGLLPFDDSDLPTMVAAQDVQMFHPCTTGRFNKLSKDCQDLIKNLMQPDMARRYTAQMCTYSPFLEDTTHVVRQAIPSETTIQNPFAKYQKDKGKAWFSKNNRFAPKTDGEVLIMPKDFFGSSNRTEAIKKPWRVKSDMGALLDDKNGVEKPMRTFVKPPSGKAIDLRRKVSDISFYDTENNVKKRMKANAFVDTFSFD